MVVIILKYSRYRINTLYTLHLHNVVCQLCLNRAGGGKKISILFAPDFELRNSGKAQLCSPVSPCDPHWGPYTAALSWVAGRGWRFQNVLTQCLAAADGCLLGVQRGLSTGEVALPVLNVAAWTFSQHLSSHWKKGCSKSLGGEAAQPLNITSFLLQVIMQSKWQVQPRLQEGGTHSRQFQSDLGRRLLGREALLQPTLRIQSAIEHFPTAWIREKSLKIKYLFSVYFVKWYESLCIRKF